MEVERRGMEMVAKSALFSVNAEKYDVFERLRYRVGGLSTELSEIVRRVLSSRQIAPGHFPPFLTSLPDTHSYTPS